MALLTVSKEVALAEEAEIYALNYINHWSKRISRVSGNFGLCLCAACVLHITTTEQGILHYHSGPQLMQKIDAYTVTEEW